MRSSLLPLFALFAFLALPGLRAPVLAAGETPEKTAPQEDEPIPAFGTLRFVEMLQNPELRKKYEGQVIDLVGDLLTMSRPSEEKPNIDFIGFGGTYQTTLYRVECRLSKPLTLAEFDRIGQSSFLAVRGRCSVRTKTKEVGSDLWYDFTITLTDASIRYWEPPKPAAARTPRPSPTPGDTADSATSAERIHPVQGAKTD